MEGENHIEFDDSIQPAIHPLQGVPYFMTNFKNWNRMMLSRKLTNPPNELTVFNSLTLRLDTTKHLRIPKAEDIASRLSGKEVFSVVDDKDGFWKAP